MFLRSQSPFANKERHRLPKGYDSRQTGFYILIGRCSPESDACGGPIQMLGLMKQEPYAHAREETLRWNPTQPTI